MFAVLVLVAGASFAHRTSAKDDNENDSEGRNGTVMSNQNDNETESENSSNENQSVRINENGDFTVTGAVVNSVAASANTINASLYGLSRDVSLANATLTGRGHAIAIADIAAGDKISAKGHYDASSRTITVSELRDISFQTREVQGIQSQIQALLDMVHKLEAQLNALQQH